VRIRVQLIKYSRTVSNVNSLEIFNELTQLAVREYFIIVCRHESFTLHVQHYEHSPFWQADREIPRLLRNPKFHYRVHESPSLVSILIHVDPIYNLQRYLIFALIL
jgi:hypothetical protein